MYPQNDLDESVAFKTCDRKTTPQLGSHGNLKVYHPSKPTFPKEITELINESSSKLCLREDIIQFFGAFGI